MRRDEPLSIHTADQLGLEADLSACSEVVTDFDIFGQPWACGDRCCIGRADAGFAAEHAASNSVLDGPIAVDDIPIVTQLLTLEIVFEKHDPIGLVFMRARRKL